MQENYTESQDIEEESGYFSFFIPHKDYFVTPVLIYLNIGVFVFMVLNGVDFLQPNAADILDYGALFRYSVMEGEFWRLFTSLFVHIGILHLAINIFTLFFIGFFLEPVIGPVSFIVFYLLSGLVASANSIFWHDYTISSGASGAIFGMYGIFFALLTTNLILKKDKKGIFICIVLFIAYNLYNGFKTGSVVDNASHIAGLVTGIISGYLIYPAKKLKIKERLLHITGMLLIISVYFFAKNKINELPNVLSDYNKTMLQVSHLENEALAAIRSGKNIQRDELIYKLTKGISNWKKSCQLIDSLGNTGLPDQLKEKLPLFKAYLQLRLDQYELYRKSLIENTDEYDTEISQIVMKIKSLQPYLH